MKSANKGKSWKRIKEGLPVRLQVREILASPNGNLYISGSTGFYFSKNRGKSWAENNIGMPVIDLYSMLIVEEKIFVGGSRGYIYNQKIF